MEEIPQIVRARLHTQAAKDHPDPDLLNAFAERALPESERTQVLTHLSRCSECRDVLALATVSANIPEKAAADFIDTARASWFHWRTLRWGAVAACVVIVGSAVLMKRDSLMMSRSAKIDAVQEQPVANQLAYEGNREAPASGPALARPEAAISAAVEPPSAKLTAEDKDKIANELPARKELSGNPQGILSKKVTGNLFTGGASEPRQPRGKTPIASATIGMRGTAPAAPVPSQEELKDFTATQTNNGKTLNIQGNSETVEVQAAAPALEVNSTAPVSVDEKHEAPGKAKASSALVMFDRMTDGATTETATAKRATGVRATRERMSSANARLSRWTISSDGQLQHSVDSGNTWQPVVVAEHATFRALSANGPDIWVGGPAGLLYHSFDSGAHWIQVKPATSDTSLKADIAAIEFTDIRQGKITTASGEVWLTDDAGQTWHKQP